MLRCSAARSYAVLTCRRPQTRSVASRDGEAGHALPHPLGEVVGLRQLLLRTGTAPEDEREARAAGLERVEERVVLAAPLRAALAGRLAVHQAGQERVQLRGEAHLVDAACVLGLLLREQVALAVLAARVGVAHEQDALLRLVPGQQHERRAFLVDPRQVEHVAVLPVLVVDVPRVHLDGRAPVDEQAVGTDRLHHPRAPRAQVVLQLAASRERSRDQKPRRQPRSSHRSPPWKAAYSGPARRPRQPGAGTAAGVLACSECWLRVAGPLFWPV